MARMRIGELLVAQGAIDAVQLESALAHQRRWGGRLGRSIVSLGFLGEPIVLGAVGAQLGVPFMELGDRHVPPAVLRLLPEKLIRTRKVLPLSRVNEPRGAAVVVALADPADLGVLDEITFATGLRVKPVLAAEDDLEQAIARLLDGATLRRGGFAYRPDAVDLPEDTSPLTLLRRADPSSYN
ncbi:general secretion pathway protein GspE [Anaeromyxobacter dehalogenans]|uniref:General secretory system II, protein E-like protein n=1 Tax=Anaeromyxobacter dehalogenans (strain 2CP-C) TaxID=290397 RepID=Q2IEU7_ANADE|nr:general secretion pathway protein GspE [Anaeromyxobacter dehalogenans]ABC83102.1 General secretory system II, protein E-like protein [Anaeromyxobacter dehalogenans 2CP-C]